MQPLPEAGTHVIGWTGLRRVGWEPLVAIPCMPCRMTTSCLARPQTLRFRIAYVSFEIQAGWPHGFHHRRRARHRLGECRGADRGGGGVVISDHDPEILAGGKAALAEKGYTADTVLLDVTKAADVARAAAEANARHGGIDILVANAGIAWPSTPGELMSDEAWLKVVDVDLNGVLLVRAASSAAPCWSADAARSSPWARCRG